MCATSPTSEARSGRDDGELLAEMGPVLADQVVAPSTLDTFLRAFTFGHVRQLDRVLGQTLTRAWQAGAGPADERLVVDVDSHLGEVHGHAKQGAAFGYTRQHGYHPILATRAGTGEVLHIRLRTDETAWTTLEHCPATSIAQIPDHARRPPAVPAAVPLWNGG